MRDASKPKTGGIDWPIKWMLTYNLTPSVGWARYGKYLHFIKILLRILKTLSPVYVY